MNDTRMMAFYAGQPSGLDFGQRVRFSVDDEVQEFASAKTNLVVIPANADDPGFATVFRRALAPGDLATVMTYRGGSNKTLADGPIDCGAVVYAANNGRVASSGTIAIGHALEEATAAGDIIECALH